MKQHTNKLQQFCEQFSIQTLSTKIAKQAIKGGKSDSVIITDVIDGV